MGDVTSVRVDDALAERLRAKADARGVNVSTLLRFAAQWIVDASDEEIDKLTRCPVCKGSGRRD